MLRTDDAGRRTLDAGRMTLSSTTLYYKLTGELKIQNAINNIFFVMLYSNMDWMSYI